MNSAPVKDSPAVNVAAGSQLPQFAAPQLKGDKAATTAKFGAVLDKASTKAPPTSAPPTKPKQPTKVTCKADDTKTTVTDTDAEEEVAAPLMADEEPVDEKEKDPKDITPLVCFCPPPEIQIQAAAPLPTKAAVTATDLPTATTDSEPTSTPSTKVPPAAIEIKSAQPQSQTEISSSATAQFLTTQTETAPLATAAAGASDLVETVRPKENESKDSPKFSAPKTDSPKAVELDTKLFDSVTAKLPEPPPIQAVKTPPAPRPEAHPAIHGTVVAQLGKAMRNNEKAAENSSGVEQKAPTGEVTRRSAVSAARFDASGLISSAPARIQTDFKVEAPAEVIPVKSLDTIHLIESIRTEVTHLRQLGQTAMSIVLRPDNGTELKLQVSVARDGSIQAQAHCERGDFQSLNAQWPQLQQSLAAHGIQMTNLSNTGNQNQQQHSPENHGNFAGGQNFDRGNQSQNRQQQSSASFEEELIASAPRFSTPKNFKQTAATPTRRWQSWA